MEEMVGDTAKITMLLFFFFLGRTLCASIFVLQISPPPFSPTLAMKSSYVNA